jgi:protocatechuate 3,4-dioxygenase beta subunit
MESLKAIHRPASRLLRLWKVRKLIIIPVVSELTPPKGPYYLRNDLVRTDLREGQAGTPLYLDIGVLDIATCLPAKDTFVEIWACNAQGDYSGFLYAPPLGAPPPGGAAPTGGFNVSKTDESNFLRGGHKTDADGIVDLLVRHIPLFLPLLRS